MSVNDDEDFLLREIRIMYAIKVHEGDTVDYTPSSDVSAGQVVIQSSLVGVALVDIPANTLGALAVKGVFDFLKYTASDVIAAGTLVYWAQSTLPGATGTSSGTTLIGKCVKASASTDTTVRVRMDQ